MKRGKGITINISNKVAYTLMAVVILAVIGGVVFAYNSNPADPAVFGHSADEIEGGFGGGSGILALGNWESKSTNTVYHADTDGYVSCYGYASDWEIYSDNNNPPTTLRARTRSGSGAYNYGTASMVKKGDYWKATQNGQVGGDSTAPVCYWIPFVNSGMVGGGSLTCTLKTATEKNAKICCEEGEYPLQHGMVNADTGGSISDDYNVGIVDNNRCLQFHATGGISYRKQVLCCK
jgi:hypothetical protein